MSQDKVRVAFVGRIKNAALSEFLAKKSWSQRQLAKELCVAPTTVNRWVLLKDAPQGEEILCKIEELLGQLREDIFPDFFRSKEWKEALKNIGGEQMVIRQVPVQALLSRGQLSLPSLEVDYDARELEENLVSALQSLSLKEEKILKFRFGIEDGQMHTLEETGKLFGVNRERIRQIESRAFKKLRRSPQINNLLPFLEK